ncbi:3'-5' exonuclease [Arthrobacter sp. TB 26]|uniref:3'-5' exonuclease n=1 Tax=Arthrobacter sp. TB 26 TaxID=494420 RepID=UPI000417F4DC|nr:3'-5' exonuclease [Arthrobacter sp. TB 26]
MTPLPTPKGRQGHVVHLSSDLHNVVLGTAGTGKSTMAMLRAIHLARAATVNFGPVLVVTYNNTLVKYLRFLGPEARKNITIETYSRFARGYLAHRGLMSNDAIAGPDAVREFVESALTAVALDWSLRSMDPGSIASRHSDWFTDELHWISGMGLATEDDYQTVTRVGRQTPLQSGQPRAFVWAVRSEYVRLRAAAGFMYDWYDMASSVRKNFATDTSQRRYRHIIIDEGQDLSPEAIRSLTAAGQPGGSLTFFGDYHQAIYGQGLSWRSSGIRLDGRPVERFVDNYRNTAEVARVAIAMARSSYMSSGDVDLVEPVQPTAAGPKAALSRYPDTRAEAAAIRDLAAELGKDQTVGILVRTRAEVTTVGRDLQYRLLHASMQRWDETPGVYLGTYHSAKGLEFDTVIMPFLNTVPYPDVLRAFAEDEACSREARLLYVSITRARAGLILTHSGKLSRLLPENAGLWSERDLT